MAIRPDTNTAGAPSKVDSGMNLAGKQHCQGGLVPVEVHLPCSPAAGAPLHDQAFSEGRNWSRVEGYIQANSGKADV